MSAIEHEESDLWADDTETELKELEDTPPPKPKKARKKPTPKVHKPLSASPFHVQRHDPVSGKYQWIALWDHHKAPTPLDLRDAYGPGRYQIVDSVKNNERWEIGADPSLPDPADDPAGYDSPPPPHLAPHLAPQSHQPPPRHQYNPQAQAPYQAGPPRHHEPPAYMAPAPHSPDPQLMSTFYRLDAAIQQISADQRRLQDEMRSVTYELQQVPTRVAERVSTAITDSVDPFDQMEKVWAISRNIADGYGPNEKDGGGGGIAEMIQAAVSAFASSAAPPQLPAPTPAAAPPAMAAAPRPPAPSSPTAPPHLDGMTQAIAKEIRNEAAKRGMTLGDAITLAQRQGWGAEQLLKVARMMPAPPAATP